MTIIPRSRLFRPLPLLAALGLLTALCVAATPAQDGKRPGGRTQWRNLVLAGDWTDTGLPATIEGAIRSGNYAADLIAKQP